MTSIDNKNKVGELREDPFASINARKDAKGKNHIDEAQDRFLKLLTTQLTNQDPMNPMENEAVTSQLAQISTVQGIEKLNKTMEQMANMYATAQSLSAANMVGRSALVAGSALSLASEVDSTGALVLDPARYPRIAVNLPKGAHDMTITVYDSEGLPVDTISLGKQEEGIAEFAWDGTNTQGQILPPGQYSFSVSARNREGEVVPADTLMYQRVAAVSWAKGEAKLHLPDGSRVGLDGIYQLGV